jgi:hypothetical protein
MAVVPKRASKSTRSDGSHAGLASAGRAPRHRIGGEAGADQEWPRCEQDDGGRLNHERRRRGRLGPLDGQRERPREVDEGGADDGNGQPAAVAAARGGERHEDAEQDGCAERGPEGAADRDARRQMEEERRRQERGRVVRGPASGVRAPRERHSLERDGGGEHHLEQHGGGGQRRIRTADAREADERQREPERDSLVQGLAAGEPCMTEQEQRERRPAGEPGPERGAHGVHGSDDEGDEEPEARDQRRGSRTLRARRRPLALHVEVERQGERHADGRGLPGERGVERGPHEPRRDDADGRGGRREPDDAGTMETREDAGAAGERHEEERHGIEMRPEARGAGEMQREGERKEDGGDARSRRPIVAARARADDAEERRERAQDDQRDEQLVPARVQPDPERLVEDRARERERHEPGPAAPPREQHEPQVEEEHVCEEADRPVAARLHEERRREAADQADARDRGRVVAPREDAACGGHRRQQEEPGRRRHELIQGCRRPEGGVEDHDARARERVGGAGVVAPEHPLRADDRRDARRRADDHAQPGWDEPVLDRVLEEEETGERERHATQDRGATHAEPALPVDERLGGRLRARRRGGGSGRVAVMEEAWVSPRAAAGATRPRAAAAPGVRWAAG